VRSPGKEQLWREGRGLTSSRLRYLSFRPSPSLPMLPLSVFPLRCRLGHPGLGRVHFCIDGGVWPARALSPSHTHTHTTHTRTHTHTHTPACCPPATPCSRQSSVWSRPPSLWLCTSRRPT
jgi:hypothetical protein